VKYLIRLYPRRWRERYGAELSRLLDDLRPMPRRARLSAGFDLVHAAVGEHLAGLRTTNVATRAAVRRALTVAAIVWAALTVEIVRSNVLFPTTEDNDGLSVVIAYLSIFAALGLTGVLACRVTTDRRTIALAGAIAGGLIGALTIATFAVVDNVFFDIISQQQAKKDGLAGSGMASMRTYVNVSLLFGFGVLTSFLALAGAGLAVAGGLFARARQR